MSIFEYDEERHIRNEKELSYREGHKQGHKTGVKEGHKIGVEEGHKIGVEEGRKIGVEEGEKQGEERMSCLYVKLMEEKRMDEIDRIMRDEAYRRKLFEEYGF